MRSAFVLGLGISGKAVVQFLIAQGYRVFGFDDRVDPDLLQEEIPMG